MILWYDVLLGVQVGPKGVHVEKDNVFNSQAYAAGAPSVTISNDPSTASSSTSTAYSGAAAQAPSASTYQNSQNTQGTYSSTNQAASSSGAGMQSPTACFHLIQMATSSPKQWTAFRSLCAHGQPLQSDSHVTLAGTVAPAPVSTGTGGGSSSSYSSAVPTSSSNTQAQAAAPMPGEGCYSQHELPCRADK